MVKVCGDECPRTIRWGSPTPAITALTSECTGLIEATTRTPSPPAAGPRGRTAEERSRGERKGKASRYDRSTIHGRVSVIQPDMAAMTL